MEAGNNLFQSVMKGEWQQVVGACTNNQVQMLKITASEDTVLHLAVRFAPTEVVLKLVEKLGENAPDILKIKNKKGNTPLHLAAAIGDMKMCHCMATKDPLLIKEGNNEGETPLFLSAFHGKGKAFFCLDFHFKETQDNDYSLCTKTIGQDTILHSAIFQEHFSLAVRITEAYPSLVNSPNESGLSPLHILASKPNAFRSSSSLEWFDTFIYQCLSSGDEKKETQEYQRAHELLQTEVQSSGNHPENIQLHTTSFFEQITTFLGWLRGIIKCIDEENPQTSSTLSEGAGTGTSSFPINSQTHNQAEELPVDQNTSNMTDTNLNTSVSIRAYFTIYPFV